ncbi:MAG: hypothetical protein LBU80_07225 [Rikenellaceae bacterium]|jgi:glycosyltransferase involved in cell wall biosynthesis|nr:hypothetical protein [Rikenellaceae bacterium]
MKISGFTIIKNAEIFDFPVVEAIRSILDAVDEFVVAVGESDDNTEALIRSIDSPKIRIVNTVWDTKKYSGGGVILAQQTDVALRACTGDWCFYVQSDEVMHESGIPIVRAACEKYLDDPHIDGFTFKYVHLYGDYRRVIDFLHFAYPREIRIVRNRPDIHSWRDAQSFRINSGFDGDYTKKEGTEKLRCVGLDALMFHYGWSRDPRLLTGKVNHMKRIYDGKEEAGTETHHDYGNLSVFPLYNGSQPALMHDRIEAMSWGDYLRYDGPWPEHRKIRGRKYRFLRFIESRLLGRRRLLGFKNYISAGRFRF